MTKSATNAQRFIALYCRVSTIEQAKEGVSLKEQEERLKAYCKAMGWSETPILFIDDGYSAKDTNRPHLKKLIESVKKGTISKILVTKLDRLSRVLYDLLGLIKLFNSHHVSFSSVGEAFDTDTSPGRLTLQVLGAVAEFERERIKERVFENMLHAANQGKWLTQSPYGYDLINKELEINKTEAKVVKNVYHYYLHQGWGFRGIAKELNEEGIPSKQKKEWSVRSIKLMLTNPVYKGTLVWNRTERNNKTKSMKDEEDWVVLEDAVPPIIDKDEWDKVQQTMNTKKIAPRAKTSPHLLGGYLRCGRCGASMSISWMGSKNNRRRVYQCSANKNKGTCTSKPYDATDVESWFKEGLLQLSESMGKSVVLKLLHKATEDEMQNLKQKIQTAQIRYQRKVEAYTAGLIDLDDLRSEKTRMETVIKKTENLKNTQSIDTEKLENQVNQKLKTILDAIDTLPVVEAKSLIRTFVDKVIINDEENIEIKLNIPT